MTQFGDEAMQANSIKERKAKSQPEKKREISPRTRRAKSKDKKAKETTAKLGADEKRPRTAFTSDQLEKLRQEFQANSYLDEKRRKSLAEWLGLNENQIKIWFQNKRAKMKKQSNQPNPLRGLLVAGGLYNHSTATSDCSESFVAGNGNGDEDEEEDVEDEDDVVEPSEEERRLASRLKRRQSDEEVDHDHDDEEARVKRARRDEPSNRSPFGSASEQEAPDSLAERVISVS